MPVADLPEIGLGTYQNTNRRECVESVRTALEVGYRHIDTAQVYHNEDFVGEGIAKADVPREDIFLATKTVHNDVPGPKESDIRDAVEGCLDRLGVDYVDMLYVHWPVNIYDPDVVLDVYDDLHAEGKIDHVGVSNFLPTHLDEAREKLDVPILAHQVEMHPWHQQEELHEYAVEHDHYLVAYSPLAKGGVFDIPEVRAVADKHDISPAQASLAWLLSKENVRAVPKGSSEEHIRQNLAAADIELDPEDIERIDNIDHEERLVDPEWGPWNQ